MTAVRAVINKKVGEKMELLDFDYDEGKYVVTFEATHEELFHIVSSIEFASHALISDYDKNVMQQLHDVLLHIISSR